MANVPSAKHIPLLYQLGWKIAHGVQQSYSAPVSGTLGILTTSPQLHSQSVN
jgi:hypothetical protein